jgi:hypothetical protein
MRKNSAGKRDFEVSGWTDQGAMHMIGPYRSVSERGAKQLAKADYGEKYIKYTAFPCGIS